MKDFLNVSCYYYYSLCCSHAIITFCSLKRLARVCVGWRSLLLPWTLFVYLLIKSNIRCKFGTLLGSTLLKFQETDEVVKGRWIMDTYNRFSNFSTMLRWNCRVGGSLKEKYNFRCPCVGDVERRKLCSNFAIDPIQWFSKFLPFPKLVLSNNASSAYSSYENIGIQAKSIFFEFLFAAQKDFFFEIMF